MALSKHEPSWPSSSPPYKIHTQRSCHSDILDLSVLAAARVGASIQRLDYYEFNIFFHVFLIVWKQNMTVT
jgi:hypothetical protein